MYLRQYLGLISLFVAGGLSIWPQPKYYHAGSSILWLSPEFECRYKSLDEGFYGWTWFWDQVSFIPRSVLLLHEGQLVC